MGRYSEGPVCSAYLLVGLQCNIWHSLWMYADQKHIELCFACCNVGKIRDFDFLPHDIQLKLGDVPTWGIQVDSNVDRRRDKKEIRKRSNNRGSSRPAGI